MLSFADYVKKVAGTKQYTIQLKHSLSEFYKKNAS